MLTEGSWLAMQKATIEMSAGSSYLDIDSQDDLEPQIPGVADP